MKEKYIRSNVGGSFGKDDLWEWFLGYDLREWALEICYRNHPIKSLDIRILCFQFNLAKWED